MQADKYCIHCDRNEWAECDGQYCPTSGGDYKDAAEFEARCVVKLAKLSLLMIEVLFMEKPSIDINDLIQECREEVEGEMQ